MRVVIEFCRTRNRDRTLAVIDRVHCETLNIEAAKGMALTLANARVMPQTPDLVRVLDEDGIEIFREAVPAGTSPLSGWPVGEIGDA